MKRIEYKAGELALEEKYGDARLEIKAAAEGRDEVALHIKAYGLAFGNIDSWGDIILPGACDKFLASEDADRMALCWQHDRSTPIGIITDKGVDDYGMWIEADILKTTAGNDAALLIKSGAVKEFSIGYRATKYHYEKREGYDYDIRILEEIEVLEVSPVTIAANKKAIIISAKADPNHTNNNHKPQSIMPENEIKAMRESIEKAVNEKMSAELNAKIKEIQAKQEKIDAQEKSIENLDKTIKDQQETIKALQDKFKEKARETFFGAFKSACEEHRDEINALLEKKSGTFRMDFDFDERKDADVTVADDITRIAWGAALDPTIAAAPAPRNAFYDTLAKETVNALFINWVEGTYTDATAYVDELAAMSDSEAKAEEKTRKLAKYGAHILLSSEVTDFFTSLYDWARGKAQDKIREFADAEIFNGAGADTSATTKKKVYGLVSQATAFSGLGSYTDAKRSDVIRDAIAQAGKQGYRLTHCFVPWADYASLIGEKDLNGRDIYTPATGTIYGVTIVPSGAMTADTMLLIDRSAVKVKERPTYELEIVRNAKLDGWDVYVRKSLQTEVKTPDKKGIIWVASVASSIAAINTDGPVAKIAGTVDTTDGAIKTKAVSAAQSSTPSQS